jgi:predicted CoA-binding protein
MEVAVLGASNRPERYSHMCMTMLAEKGHTAIPVNPKETMVMGHYCYHALSELKKEYPNLHTLTLYVNPDISAQMETEILELAPKRVIFNPGSENHHLQKLLEGKGIECLEACSLVMLRTGQF